MTEPRPVDPDAVLADITVLRDPNTGKPYVDDGDEETAEQKQVRARSEAAKRKAIFEHRRAGAEARAGRLPRRLTNALASGATNLMLSRIIQEEVVPITAKEAAEVAKITHAIAQASVGEGRSGVPLTDEERKERLAEAAKFEAVLEQRASEATAALDGTPGPEFDPEQWDDGVEVPATPQP